MSMYIQKHIQKKHLCTYICIYKKNIILNSIFRYLPPPVPGHRARHLHSDPSLQSAFTGCITGHGQNRFKHRLLRQCPGFGERLSTHRTGSSRLFCPPGTGGTRTYSPAADCRPEAGGYPVEERHFISGNNKSFFITHPDRHT